MERSVEPFRCVECGRELIEGGSHEPPERCDDCRPETGAGSLLLDRVAINVRRLRLAAGIEPDELAKRAALSASHLAQLEGGVAGEPTIVRALRLTHSLDASLDRLTERIYWTPGQIRLGAGRPLPAERLSGFFLVPPSNVPVFEAASQPEPVVSREQAAEIFGGNLREARERRHLTQETLAQAADLSKSGLSLIERGRSETTVETLLALARGLEVPPELLLDGIRWRPKPQAHRPSSGARRAAHSLDGAIRHLWSENRTAREIARMVGTSPGTVSATVHRLRERGEHVGYRRPPTRRMHERARQRRDECASPGPQDEAIKEPAAVAKLEKATDEQVAARIGANVALRRREARLSLRQLAEVSETDHTYLHRTEKGTTGIPKLALILRLAGSLNVKCSLIASGVVWDWRSGSFRIEETPPEPHTEPRRLGLNASRARHRLDFSQQALSDRASMSRGDVVDFEYGSRNFRLFTLIRLTGALGVGYPKLFEGVANWHVRPLAAPEFPPGERPTKAERDQLLVRLWNEGRPEREIAEALDLSPRAVAPYVRELRDAGTHIPYRRPSRSPAEAAARCRRNGHTASAQPSRSTDIST